VRKPSAERLPVGNSASRVAQFNWFSCIRSVANKTFERLSIPPDSKTSPSGKIDAMWRNRALRSIGPFRHVTLALSNISLVSREFAPSSPPTSKQLPTFQYGIVSAVCMGHGSSSDPKVVDRIVNLRRATAFWQTKPSHPPVTITRHPATTKRCASGRS
jgi:hypothetical protein